MPHACRSVRNKYSQNLHYGTSLAQATMDRLISPPSLTTRLSSAAAFEAKNVDAFPCCYPLKEFTLAQLAFVSGLLFWIGAWDSSDIIEGIIEANGSTTLLWPLVMVGVGGGGLALLSVALACCNRHGREVRLRRTGRSRLAHTLAYSLDHDDRPTEEVASLLDGTCGVVPSRVSHHTGQSSANVSRASSQGTTASSDRAGKGPLTSICWDGMCASAGRAWCMRSFVGLLNVVLGLSLYLGLWNLIDYNLLVRLDKCAHTYEGPAVDCLYVKIGVAVLGLCGLCVTGGLAAAADGNLCECITMNSSQGEPPPAQLESRAGPVCEV